MANDGSVVIATKLHCVRCGGTWGDGKDTESSGICPQCFIEWAKSRKPCFGDEAGCDEMHCSFYKFCKEYYGIR